MEVILVIIRVLEAPVKMEVPLYKIACAMLFSKRAFDRTASASEPKNRLFYLFSSRNKLVRGRSDI